MRTKSEKAEQLQDFRLLEEKYKPQRFSGTRVLQSLFLSVIFAVMVFLAFGIFGNKHDREKFTTDVTPVHVELSPISGSRQTADNLHNIQL